MSRIGLTIATNGLSADVSIAAGPKATAADLAAAIAKAGVVHGIDAAAVAALGSRLDNPKFSTKVKIAQGDAPQPGADGRIELAAAMDLRSGTADAEGRMNFRERELLHPAAAGATIGWIVAPTPGTPGRDVRGRTLPAPPCKPFNPRLGKGVQRGANESLVAVRAGVVSMTGTSSVDVIDLWKHDADVDLRSGNLHTRGSLLVNGDVREGGMATADGDVVVSGAVLDASVRAAGNVKINQGVMGEKSFVDAGGALHAHHATSATLCARHELCIDDQMVHCWVQAEKIEMLHGRGHAFGGELWARQSVRLLVAGTENGAPTVLCVGDFEPIARMCARRDALRHARTGASSALKTVDYVKTRGEDLAKSSITVQGTCWPGVRVQFGAATFEVREPMHKIVFRWDADSNAIVHADLL